MHHCKFLIPSAIQLLTPSVHEKVFLRYQFIDDADCWGFGTSLGMLNHTYHAQQRTCFKPTSLQSSLSRKSKLFLELHCICTLFCHSTLHIGNSYVIVIIIIRNCGFCNDLKSLPEADNSDQQNSEAHA